MIHHVTKVSDSEYIINECIRMKNVEFIETDIIYDIDYDEKTVTEKEAIEVCEDFLRQAINDYIKEMDIQTRADAKAAQTAGL